MRKVTAQSGEVSRRRYRASQRIAATRISVSLHISSSTLALGGALGTAVGSAKVMPGVLVAPSLLSSCPCNHARVQGYSCTSGDVRRCGLSGTATACQQYRDTGAHALVVHTFCQDDRTTGTMRHRYQDEAAHEKRTKDTDTYGS
jgi:hypothetical protein